MVAVCALFESKQAERFAATRKQIFIGHIRGGLETDEAEDRPSIDDALAAIGAILEGGDLMSCFYLLTVFTGDPDFEFGEPLPSQLVTVLIALLQDAGTDPRLLGLVLEFIANLWHFYDADLPLLTDPELVDCVWQRCVQTDSIEISNAAFAAFLCLAKSDLEATRDMYSEGALNDLRLLLESASFPPELILNCLKYLTLIADTDDGGSLGSYCPFLVGCLCESQIKDIELLAVDILVSLISRHSVCLTEDMLNAIVGHLRDSPDLTSAISSYSILRVSHFFLPVPEFAELLVRDVNRCAAYPAFSFYHYLELFMSTFPALSHEQGIVDALMNSVDEMCCENKQFAGLVIASYLALPEMDPNLRTELLAAGMLELLCDIVQSVDLPTALILVRLLPQIVAGSESGLSAAILDRDFISGLRPHGDEPVNDDFREALAALERLLIDQATVDCESFA
jgi:hypothetical protein